MIYHLLLCFTELLFDFLAVLSVNPSEKDLEIILLRGVVE